MTARCGFAVFEALNHVRKEILVGIAAQPIPESVEARMRTLLVDAAHWEPTDEVSFRRLAENMPAGDARKFADLYAFYIEKGDWRIIRQTRAAGELP